MKYLIVLILALFAVSSVNAGSNLECEFCEFAVGYAEKYIASNATETEVIDKIEKLCNFVPSELEATCDSLTSVYGKQFINTILNRESPSAFCAQIKICNTTTTTTTTKAVNGGIECEACAFIVGEVEKYLEGNATETQILKFLNTDCKIFGGDAATCQSLVDTYVPTIIKMLENDQPSSTVCSEIGLCGSNIQKPVEGAFECEVCGIVVTQCETYVKANKTESEIVALLDQYCSDLSIFKSACDTIVANSAPKIINLIMQNQNPSIICDEIGCCGSSSQASSDNTQSSSDNSQSSTDSQSESSDSQSESSDSSYSGSMTGVSSGTGSSGTSGSMKIYIQ
ncbi:hypothetical protein RB653_000178 [Dictyostelium firmibasis]|uniref:Pulmonary surfactant-associated protein B n=1 Tax=Dictyostelium firmibasis TaxID=79012 RepID=A0AAN7U2G2_9MYCE